MIVTEVVAAAFVLAGSLLMLLAAVGLIRFDSSYARFHAAGKASPVGFVLIAIGVALTTGLVGAAKVAVATTAMVLTLPVAVHLLFRAVHRTEGGRKRA